jgi:hypothetical protein
VTLPTKLRLGFALWLCTPICIAQSNLGELLDAGGRMLSPEEFKLELVQRVVVGPTPTGGTLEVIYASNGSVQGKGSNPSYVALQRFRDDATIAGEWRIDDKGRVCTNMRMSAAPGNVLILAPRCQSWFKYDQKYFLSDSDWDRSAKVLPRTVKQ